MGISGSKTASDSDTLAKATHDAYPEYYIEGVTINSNDEELTTTSWNLLMSGHDTEVFRTKKKIDPNFMYTTTLSWFYDSFYHSFFELAPDIKSMFTNVSIVHQGKLLAAVIASALSSLKKPTILRKKLLELVIGHNAKGVKAAHYGKMGLALVGSLEEVLGTTVFSAEIKRSWLRIYSFMLSIIVPEAVKFSLGLGKPDISTLTRSNSTSTISGAASHIENTLLHMIHFRPSNKVYRQESPIITQQAQGEQVSSHFFTTSIKYDVIFNFLRSKY